MYQFYISLTVFIFIFNRVAYFIKNILYLIMWLVQRKEYIWIIVYCFKIHITTDNYTINFI